MSWLDAVIIIVLVIFSLLGLRMGVIKAVAGFLGVILGIVIAGQLFDSLDFIPFNENETANDIVSFIVIFVVVFLAFSFMGFIARGFVHFFMLGWVDRLGGSGLGFLGGILVSWVLIVLLAKVAFLSGVSDAEESIQRNLPEGESVGEFVEKFITGGGSFEDLTQTLKLHETLEKALVDSALVSLFVNYFPQFIFGILPNEFEVAESFLKLDKDSQAQLK